MAETLHDFMKKVSLFKDFDEEESNLFIRGMHRVRLKPGEVLCKKGDEANSLYIIREGVIEVRDVSYMGGEVVLARLSEGMVVGEMALVDSCPRSATLVSEGESTLYEITRWDFEDLLEDMSPTYYKLLSQIALISCARIRDVNRQIEHYILHPADLFDPEVKTGLENPTLKKRVTGFLKYFKSK